MKIIEQFIKGKYNDPDLCEDAICVTDDKEDLFQIKMDSMIEHILVLKYKNTLD